MPFWLETTWLFPLRIETSWVCAIRFASFHACWIRGDWIAASGGARYSIRNPAHPAERLGDFADSTVADAAAAVAAASSAAGAWADTPGPQRGSVLFRFAQLLEESKHDLARIITYEQGKALTEAVPYYGD